MICLWECSLLSTMINKLLGYFRTSLSTPVPLLRVHSCLFSEKPLKLLEVRSRGVGNGEEFHPSLMPIDPLIALAASLCAGRRLAHSQAR